MITTTLEWHRTADKLPEGGVLVLVADSDGDTDAAFFAVGTWRYSDATPAPVPQFWAHFPAGPEASNG